MVLIGPGTDWTGESTLQLGRMGFWPKDKDLLDFDLA